MRLGGRITLLAFIYKNGYSCVYWRSMAGSDAALS